MRTELSFDELALLPGCDVWAFGTADIEYSVAPPEPDVGIFRAYADDWHIVAIDVGRVLSPDEPLYRMIESALYRNEAIERHLQKEIEQC